MNYFTKALVLLMVACGLSMQSSEAEAQDVDLICAAAQVGVKATAFGAGVICGGVIYTAFAPPVTATAAGSCLIGLGASALAVAAALEYCAVNDRQSETETITTDPAFPSPGPDGNLSTCVTRFRTVRTGSCNRDGTNCLYRYETVQITTCG